MTTFPNILIRASAGTGKTFQLSNRFIQLLHSGVPAEQILAVTFTRLAAGEIMDRVMQRLAEAASDDKKAAQLSAELHNPSLNRERCLDLTEQLTRQLHRLRIETLDSYFSRLARSFSLELGTPPGWRIVEEIKDQQIRSEAIQAMLRNDAYDVIQFMSLLFQGDAERNITQKLFDIVRDLYDLYRESEPGAWSNFPKAEILDVAELRAAIGEFLQTKVPVHKSIQESFEYECDLAVSRDWEQFIAKGNVAQIIAGKTTYRRKQYEPETIAAYQKLIDHARGVLLKDLENQTIATFELLQRFDTHYQKLKRNSSALRFDDVTYLLSRHAELNSIRGQSYRMDTQIAHLLVDEFQDTSLAQWQVIRPLAEQLTESAEQKSFFFTGGPTSFFCVGDVKQAIYGWRGGRAEIFDALDQQLHDIQPQELNKSYRSSQVIIDVVNQVFSGMSAIESLGRAEPAVHQWAANFPKHETAKELPGYVRLMTSRGKRANENPSAANYQYAAERIAEIQTDTQQFSIGVLVRKNSAVALIVNYLRDLGIRASEERGGNQLSDSAAVQIILSMIKLADHPGDSVARFHLSQSVIASQIDLPDHRDAQRAADLAADVRQQLLAEGYAASIKKWAHWINPVASNRQRRRLQQLVHLAESYQSIATLRPSDFLDFVESKRIPDPTPAQIRVMTIHQAKGLEFDIVVLPDLDINLVGQTGACVYGRSGPTELVNQVCRRRRKEIQAVLPKQLQGLFQSATLEDVTEELCIFYVAMTRAVHALHLIVQPGHHNRQMVSRLVRKTLSDTRDVKPDMVLFEEGDPQWFEKAVPPIDKIESEFTQVEIDQPIQIRAAAKPTLALPMEAPSQTAEQHLISADQLLRLGNIEALARGTLFHAWLELVTWLEDGTPQRRELEAIAQSVSLGQLRIDDEIRNFENMLALPEMQSNLSRKFYDDPTKIGLPKSLANVELDLSHERRFVCQFDDRFLNGSIDRLVLLRSNGQVEAADIIDFKTDVVDPSEPQSIRAKAEQYREQLAGYRSAIARIYNLSHDRIATRLIFANYGIVHTMDHQKIQVN